LEHTLIGKNIAFIGGGNMATSLIGGLIARGYRAAGIRVSDPVKDNRRRLAENFGVVAVADNNDAVQGAEVVILAVKPQVMASVATGLAPALDSRPVVVSIAAGIPVRALQSWLGPDMPVVRCMPNTPALVGSGATGLFASPQVSDAQKADTGDILAAVGTVDWVADEALIDAVTALSGSGPAYFFLVMEAMQKAGVAMGLPTETARQLTLQTALGAARMATSSGEDVAELRRRVTSPGGTTERAIGRFVDGGLPELFASAMNAALDRAREMATEFSDSRKI